jgi:hypothetical protein
MTTIIHIIAAGLITTWWSVGTYVAVTERDPRYNGWDAIMIGLAAVPSFYAVLVLLGLLP